MAMSSLSIRADEFAAAMVQPAAEQADVPAMLEREEADAFIALGEFLDDVDG